jgi:release factor glutamine methyltransferase
VRAGLAVAVLAAGVSAITGAAAVEEAVKGAAWGSITGRQVALLRGDWTEGLGDESFDVVVANPPYIPSTDIQTLDPEVRDHEPHLALDGGTDGLDAYRRLAPEILRVLKPDGVFAVEIGWDQSSAVEALFRAAGAEDVRTRKDLADRDRVVGGAKKPLGNPFPNR